MVRLLGLIDIVAGFIFLAGFYQLEVPRGLLIAVGVILICKGLVFLINFFSWIDVAAGILLIFGLSSILPPQVLIGLTVYLALKGLFSLLTFS